MSVRDNPGRGDTAESSPFRSQIGPLLFLTGIFLLNFLSRIILAPLLPSIEKDMGVGHGDAGSLFLMISLGMCPMTLCSGFFSSRMTHRKTIILSSTAVGAALLIVSLTHTLGGVRLGLLMVGMAAGLYLPSGLATLTTLVSSRDWGKAVAIHELAPTLGFVAAPLLAEVLLRFYSWQGVLALLGGASLFTGAAFACFGRGGRFFGEAPSPGTLRDLLAEPALWIMIALFTLGIGASLGVYTMLPLYLITELEMERGWANTLVALSRVPGPGVVILAGWGTDRLGTKRALKYVFLATGIMTVLLGAAQGSLIMPVVFLQPMLAACFFPAGFAALSRIGPSKTRNVAVSLTLPTAFLLATGVIPAGIGILGEAGLFAVGFAVVGGLTLGGVWLVRYLKFSDTHMPSP
ncbi:MAG: MFS transporter [Deltaproteobacteria bacterium]|nr:MFS transporter [Deltaproteobacteria bacterium]MBW2306251.1 MFS transporter [Deltaproteobacteria bacterium]